MQSDWLDADGRIATETPCAHCGYDLRTRRVDEVCTECGRPVVDVLRMAPGWWLRRVRWGAVVLILAAVTEFLADSVIPIVADMRMPTIGQTTTRPAWTLWTELALFDAPVVLTLLGGFWLTARHQFETSSWRASVVRRVARAALLLLLALQLEWRLRWLPNYHLPWSIVTTLSVVRALDWIAVVLLLAECAIAILAAGGRRWILRVAKILTAVIVLAAGISAFYSILSALAAPDYHPPPYPYATQFPSVPGPFYYVWESRLIVSCTANLPDSIPIWEPPPRPKTVFDDADWIRQLIWKYRHDWDWPREAAQVVLFAGCIGALSVAIRHQSVNSVAKE